VHLLEVPVGVLVALLGAGAVLVVDPEVPARVLLVAVLLEELVLPRDDGWCSLQASRSSTT
jgi:hypothetical protein